MPSPLPLASSGVQSLQHCTLGKTLVLSEPRMRVLGQFNLGFAIAAPSSSSTHLIA